MKRSGAGGHDPGQPGPEEPAAAEGNDHGNDKSQFLRIDGRFVKSVTCQQFGLVIGGRCWRVCVFLIAPVPNP